MKIIKLLKIALIISIVITLCDILYRIYEISYLKRIINEVYVSKFENSLYSLKIGYYYWIDLSINLCIVILFISWLYKFYNRLYPDNIDKFSYSPKWTILGFIIPLANFYIPYRIVTDLWEQTSNRRSNYSKKNTLVKLWWFPLIISVIYARVNSSHSSLASYANDILHYNYHYLLIDLTYLVSLYFWIKLINEIEYSQND